MRTGPAQTGRKGGGHLWQQQHDDRGRECGREKPRMNANERELKENISVH
jgi:hypothetical protein